MVDPIHFLKKTGDHVKSNEVNPTGIKIHEETPLFNQPICNKDELNLNFALGGIFNSNNEGGKELVSIPNNEISSPKEKLQALINPVTINTLNEAYPINGVVKNPNRRKRSSYIYQVDDQGYLCLREDEGALTRLCNFTIITVLKVIEDNGDTQAIYFIFDVVIENTEIIRSGKVTLQELKRVDWILELSGFKTYLFPDISNAHKHILIHIAQQLKHVPTQTIFSHTGWQNIGGYNVYLHKGGAIGSIPWDIACSSDKQIEYSLTTTSPKEAFDRTFDMIDISDNKLKTVPLLLFAHLAPLTKLFFDAGCPVRFLLWVFGTTQTMKTTTMKLFFNLFNRSQDKTSASFLDTVTSVECKASEYKDAVFLLDDYFPPEERRSQDKMMNVLEQTIRIFGDSVSKSRRTNTLEAQKEFKPAGVCAISGEDTAGQLSALGRCLTLEIDAADFIPDKISFYQNNPHYYSNHFYYFIEWLAKNYNMIVGKIKSEYPILREKYRATCKNKRSIDAMVSLLIAGDILGQYGMDINCFDSQYHNKMMGDFTAIIQFAGEKHAELMDLQKPELLYLIAVDALVSSGRLVVLDRYKSINLLPKNLVGFQDERNYYLFAHLAYNEVIRFFKTRNKIYATGMSMVHKQLDSLHLLETEKNSKTKKVSIPALEKIEGVSDRPRFLVIDKALMANILDSIS